MAMPAGDKRDRHHKENKCEILPGRKDHLDEKNN
jgi:hypothetical protein